jgi:hypothetical protein
MVSGMDEQIEPPPIKMVGDRAAACTEELIKVIFSSGWQMVHGENYTDNALSMSITSDTGVANQRFHKPVLLMR